MDESDEAAHAAILRPCEDAPMARRVAEVALLGATAWLLGACGADASPSATLRTASPTSVAAAPTPSPSPTPSPEPSLTAADDLSIGDCLGAMSAPVIEVAIVDCEEMHLHEVFAVLEHEAGAEEGFPGEEVLARHADDVCLAPFEAYVAVDYLESAYWITSIVPSEAGWAEGDRRIVCALRLGEEGGETAGSARGSGE
jgi:hypothetical protein